MIASSMTLREFFAQVYSPKRRVAPGSTTALQYGIQIRHFGRFLGREPVLSDFDDDTLDAFLLWFADDGGALKQHRAAPTRNKARTHLVALWRLAAEKRFVEEFPAVKPLPEPQRIPRAWTVEELSALYKASREMPGVVCGIPAGVWWEALHRVLFETGERIGAVFACKWDWLSTRTHRLTIPAEFRKGGRVEMEYTLREPTIELLRQMREPKRALVFPWPRTLNVYYQQYDLLLRRAGLPGGRKNKSQKMRRSFASHLEAAGQNATEALHHAFRRTTVESYLDPAIVGRTAFSQHLPEVG